MRFVEDCKVIRWECGMKLRKKVARGVWLPPGTTTLYKRHTRLLSHALYHAVLSALWKSMSAFTLCWPRCPFPHKLLWFVLVCHGASPSSVGVFYRRRPRTRVCRKPAAISTGFNKRQTFAFFRFESALIFSIQVQKQRKWHSAEAVSNSLPRERYWPFLIVAICFHSCLNGSQSQGPGQGQRPVRFAWASVSVDVLHSQCLSQTVWETRRLSVTHSERCGTTEHNPQSSALKTITAHDTPVNTLPSKLDTFRAWSLFAVP